MSYPIQVRAVELMPMPADIDPAPPAEAGWQEAAPGYAQSPDVRMETQDAAYPEGATTVR